MPDHPAPVDSPEPAGRPGTRARASSLCGTGSASGEEPVAFGAVVVALARDRGARAGSWAGARHRWGAAGGRPLPPRAPSAPAVEAPGPLAGSAGPIRAATADRRCRDGGARGRSGGPPGPVPPSGGVPSGRRAGAGAGGSLPRADLDRLNLAARLVDGQKVLVTRRGDTAPPGTIAGRGGERRVLAARPGMADAGGAHRPQRRRPRRPRLAAGHRAGHRPGHPRGAGPAGRIPLDPRPAPGAGHRRRPLRPPEGPRPGMTTTPGGAPSSREEDLPAVTVSAAPPSSRSGAPPPPWPLRRQRPPVGGWCHPRRTGRLRRRPLG